MDCRYNLRCVVGVGGVSLISFGHMKHEVEDIIESVNFISETMYDVVLEGLQKNTNLQTEEIVATIKEDMKGQRDK